MLQRLHKIFIFAYLICCFAICPVVTAQGENVDSIQSNTVQTVSKDSNTIDNNQMNLVQNEVSVNDIDIEPLNTQNVKKNVVPDTKKEGRKVIALFIKTMMAVVLCAIILYLILIFIKKYYASAFVNNEEIEDDESLDLTTPANKTEALKSFLNRTR